MNYVLIALLGIVLTGCCGAKSSMCGMHEKKAAVAAEVAPLKVTVPIIATLPDSKVAGEVLLVEEKGGVSVSANVTNVTPGMHGFHFHENGSCAEEGKAAGSHFNPDAVSHGMLTHDGFEKAHAGDMGNIEVGENGQGQLTEFLPGLSLKEGKYALVGRAIVLHEKADDFSQPTGNAGGRIGCGVITVE